MSIAALQALRNRVHGLRFFTVYGSMGRPDMDYFRFAGTLRARGLRHRQEVQGLQRRQLGARVAARVR